MRQRTNAAVPPYHPSYNENNAEPEGYGSHSTSSSPDRESFSSNEYRDLDVAGEPPEPATADDDIEVRGMRMRRGSEGLEMQLPDREAMLRNLLREEDGHNTDPPLEEPPVDLSHLQDAGRYQSYQPDEEDPWEMEMDSSEEEELEEPRGRSRQPVRISRRSST